ncbi:MAG: ParB N-terminal domain-containing protein, partial [Clostridia bacterium]
MPKINPRIRSLDDLLGVARKVENTAATEDKPAQPGNNEIQMLPPEIIRGFRGHPFRLYEGDRFNDLVDSVSENGVLSPTIIRKIEPDENGFEYEMLAGHNRQNAAILLVYAQDEDVTILATKKQWAGVGRNLISRPKGIAVCVYSNARLTLDYLFDISQTMGKEIHPTNWQLSDEMQKALGERLTFSHGFQTQPFPDLLYALAREAVNDNYEHYLQGLRQETKNHLFEEIPAGGFEAQYIQLLSDSVSYFIGKKCHLPDEAIRMGDGMAT